MRLGILTFFASITLSITSVQVYSQCSIVTLNGSAKTVPGMPVTITAQVSSTVPSSNLVYRWKLSGGTITTGENTSSITIDTTGLGGQIITVSVEVGGVTTTCSPTAERIIEVTQPPIPIHDLDWYGNIRFVDEQARLDNFAIGILNSDKSYFGHIVAYGSYLNEAKERLARAKNYLVRVRGIAPNRIITTDAGYSTELKVALWILPGGSSPLFSERGSVTEPLPQPTTKRKKRN